MIVEWELTMKCNYKCFYCTNLDKSIKPILDENEIQNFIQMLGEKYPDVEIFLFGGEPFLHPKIHWIIKCFNEFKIPFVIQTNFSEHSIKIMKTIVDPFRINISIHPSEISIEKLPKLFEYKPDIKVIDVMYTGKNSIDYYFNVKKLIEHKNTFLTPITDFGDGYSDTLLREYLTYKNNSIYKKIINFENIERIGKQRSDIWIDKNFTTFGKPCLYKDTYFLYGPNLDLYNCCYRIKTDGICPKPKCFLM